MTVEMASDDDRIDVASACSRLFGFLASLFRQPPPESLLRLLSDEECEEADDLRQLFGSQHYLSLAVGAREALASPELLPRDFDELLRIPRDRYVVPYESAYRGTPAKKTRGRGLLMGRHARQVASLYRMAGFALGGECRELPDHVSVELEFVASCAAKESSTLSSGRGAEADGWRDLRVRFLTDHVMPWVPSLCREMELRAATAFYRAMARAMPQLLARGLEVPVAPGEPETLRATPPGLGGSASV